MTNLSRIFSLVIVLIAPLALFAARPGSNIPSSKTYRGYVGTYTAKTNSKGIYEFRFDASTGKMSALELAAETKDPSWVAVHPNGKYLYSVNESGKASTVSAFAIDRQSGKLTLLNQLSALGEDPCHLSFDRTGKYLLVANYTSGNVVVFPILADGKLGSATSAQEDSGPLGPNKNRQEGPHAHWIATALDNHSVYVADLGLDRVLVYQFDATKGLLTPAVPPYSLPPDAPGVQVPIAAPVAPGTGPRHVALSGDGHFMYVLGELNSTVTVFPGGTRTVYQYIQTIPMLPANFSGRNDAAEIEIHPSGKFLYASNRGHDSIVAYAIDPESGTLTQVGDIPTGGKEPRHFAIDPTGNFLLAENQLSDTIVEFRIDPATGKLTSTGETLRVPAPVCITFLPLE
jgi:6-phosphogluconolactonase